MAEVKRLGEFDGVEIYLDSNMEENNILVGRKSKDVISPGIIFVPNEIWEEGLRTMQAAPIDEYEIRQRYRKSQKVRYVDIKFVVGGTSEIERYQSFLQLLKINNTDAN